MANSDAKMQSNSIYYNIDIYNDNSTNGDISSKFQTAFNSPLLMDTSNYEVAVARARVPIDQIPLSQENIPFQKWQIEIGVPSVANPPTYTYYNSYVPQFNPNIIIDNTNTAILGINNQSLNSMVIDAIQSPSGDIDVSITPMPSQSIIRQRLTDGGTQGYTNLSNITYTLNYIAQCTQTSIIRYTYAGVLHDTTAIRPFTSPDAVIRGICSSQLSDTVYALCYDAQLLGGLWFIQEVFGINSYVHLLTQSGANFAATTNIYSFSCSVSRLSLSIVDRIEVLGEVIVPLVYDIGGTSPLFPRVNPDQVGITGTFMFYLDNSNRYYKLKSGSNGSLIQTDILTATNTILSFNIPNPQYTLGVRFLGTDTWDNFLVNFYDTNAGTSSISAYNKINGGNAVYTIQLGTSNPVSMSNFITVPDGQNVILPSLTPNYQVMTINEYLRQINLAFVSIFSQIPTPLSSPVLAPRLVFDSAGIGIVSIVCDPGCASSLSTACVINFNQLLWSFFKFISIQAVNTAIGGSARTLTINNAVPGKNSITAQPSPTIYRFSDLTRIIISTSRMGVLGDNEGNNKLLVNIGDFTVDTENGIPNLVIYNPEILRFYKLYQNTPLTNIDVFISYANRAGNVFPVTISPYNSIGLKLEFQRIPLEHK